jgi:hypothetical protein
VDPEADEVPGQIGVAFALEGLPDGEIVIDGPALVGLEDAAHNDAQGEGRAASQGQDRVIHMGFPRVGQSQLAHEHGGEDGGHEQAHGEACSHHDAAHHCGAGQRDGLQQHGPAHHDDQPGAGTGHGGEGREVGGTGVGPAHGQRLGKIALHQKRAHHESGRQHQGKSDGKAQGPAVN